MNKGNSTAITILIVLVILGIAFAIGFFGMRGYGGYGYHGWGMMGPWMMGGMFFMWLIPLGILVLSILGVFWLVQTLSGRNNPPAATHTCPSCGRNVQADWKNCPYCGTALGT